MSREPGGAFRYETEIVASTLALFLYLCSTVFRGLYHDGMIYGMLAVDAVGLGDFAADPHFRFGSQAAFSLFPGLYGLAISVLGIGVAGKLVVLSGFAFWCMAAAIAARFLPSGGWRIFTLLVIATTSWNYSPNLNTFLVNEGFATARSIAIPLGLASFLLLLRGKTVPAFGVALISTALHPLVGGWAIVMTVLSRMNDRAAVLAMVSAIGLPFAAALIHPLGSLAMMDEAWLGGVRLIAADLLVSNQEIPRVDAWLAVIGSLWWGAYAFSGAERRILTLLAMVCAWGLLTAVVTSYWLPVALMVQLQLWRVLVLSTVVAVLAFAYRVSRFSRPEIAILIAVSLFSWAVGVWSSVPALMAVATRFGVSERVRALPVEHRVFAAMAVAFAVIVHVPGFVVDLQILGASLRYGVSVGLPGVWGLFLGGGFGLGLAIWALLLRTKQVRFAVMAALIPAIYWAGSTWDARPPEELRADLALRGRKAITDEARARGSLLVEGHLPTEIWFALGRSGYVEPEHLTGTALSREKWALVRERMRRVAIASRLNLQDRRADNPDSALSAFISSLRGEGLNPDDLRAYKTTKTRFTPDGARFLCEDPELEAIITVGERAIWGFGRPGATIENGRRLFVYPCAEMNREQKLRMGVSA